VLAFGYFVPGVRHVTAIAAGAGSMDAWTFVLYAFPGGVLWCAVFLTLGYYAGNEWHTVAGAVESHVARAIVVTAFGVAELVLVKRHRGKREAQREIATEARRHRAH
jgi:membrane protein DedA with SNARE-associated domain